MDGPSSSSNIGAQASFSRTHNADTDKMPPMLGYVNPLTDALPEGSCPDTAKGWGAVTDSAKDTDG